MGSPEGSWRVLWREIHIIDPCPRGPQPGVPGGPSEGSSGPSRKAKTTFCVSLTGKKPLFWGFLGVARPGSSRFTPDPVLGSPKIPKNDLFWGPHPSPQGGQTRPIRLRSRPLVLKTPKTRFWVLPRRTGHRFFDLPEGPKGVKTGFLGSWTRSCAGKYTYSTLTPRDPRPGVPGGRFGPFWGPLSTLGGRFWGSSGTPKGSFLAWEGSFGSVSPSEGPEVDWQPSDANFAHGLDGLGRDLT